MKPTRRTPMSRTRSCRAFPLMYSEPRSRLVRATPRSSRIPTPPPRARPGTPRPRIATCPWTSACAPSGNPTHLPESEMPLQAKNRKAHEFRAQADAIRAELMDETKTFTKDEIETKASGIAALERRAQIAAEFTLEDEIERQGGDELVKKSAPENDEEQSPNYAQRIKELAARVDRVFGGPNALILALAKRSIEPLNTRQEQVVRAIREFQTRATIVGTASDASGGEFLLPLQQVASPKLVAFFLEFFQLFGLFPKCLPF